MSAGCYSTKLIIVQGEQLMKFHLHMSSSQEQGIPNHGLAIYLNKQKLLCVNWTQQFRLK